MGRGQSLFHMRVIWLREKGTRIFYTMSFHLPNCLEYFENSFNELEYTRLCAIRKVASFQNFSSKNIDRQKLIFRLILIFFAEKRGEKKTNKKQVLVSAHLRRLLLQNGSHSSDVPFASESFLFSISRIFFENAIAIDSICSSHGYSGIIWCVIYVECYFEILFLCYCIKYDNYGWNFIDNKVNKKKEKWKKNQWI